MKRWDPMTWWLIAIGAFVVACIALILYLLHNDKLARDACMRQGGQIKERINCRWIQTAHKIGETTIYIPHESCEWRCERFGPKGEE